MPSAYTGRVTLILVVLYIAICAIFPRAPFSLFLPLQNDPMSWEHDLRPGIDMVGGTSLVYEIEASDEAAAQGNLAEEIATALKRRVDPNGVLNLIWRPQGNKLEIQLPLSGDGEAADEARSKYQAAREALAGFVVSPRQVILAVENSTGDERATKLEALAMNSPGRLAIYNRVADAYDALQAAEAEGIITEIAAAEQAYQDARNELGNTNLSVDAVQAALDSTTDQREAKLAEFAAENDDFPERQAALDAYVAANDAYASVRNEIADTATLKRLLQGSGVLAFHIVADDAPATQRQEMVDRLMRFGPRTRAGDELRWFEIENEKAEQYNTQLGPDGKPYLLVWNTNELSIDSRDGEWGLARAMKGVDGNGFKAVDFRMDALGAQLFGDLSGANIGRPLAIVLDNTIISAPTLQGRISSSGNITGGRSGFSDAEQTYLAQTLNAGALPARLSEDPISERTVGPQLGRANLVRGLWACVYGLVIVAVFLIGYYYTSGVVAFIAVLMNMVIILASMAALQATFTLPSIAGIILSLGMAVDANVLIFERLREEQARGLSIRMALRNAYDRAFSAILDSNVTTGITAAILYALGSEEVKGFGLTLLIGIFASLFTALYVTKTIFGLMIDKFNLSNLGSLPLTLPKLNEFLTPNVDWMKKAGLFGGISAVIIAVGLALFGYYFVQGRVLDIEFAGGTTAQFELNEPMETEAVRQALEVDDVQDPLVGLSVVKIEATGGASDDTVYEVVVPNQDDEGVTATILERLGDRLNIQQPSTFAGHNEPFESVEGDDVFPLTDGVADRVSLPLDPDRVAANLGGVAIVLRDLQPMLERGEILSRLSQQRLKGAYDAEGLRGGVSTDVEVFPGEGAAVVYLSNERFAYTPGDQEVNDAWRAELARPAWQVTVDAVSNPDELQKVTNIGAQVAGEFKRDATLAIVLSVLAIMAYIWIRFGDLKYSTATVIALAHDTLFCIAAIGYAHFLAGNFLGDLLLLDPFRLNLTMVAAVLTVMGFSMNDTVVVFDRIRENRGPYGMITRKVINDSINQTLSRTLLTGGTTIVTIAVMFAFGGPGIHGFTYAMLVGIVTGTYSSIAIASPILLFGKQDETAPEGSSLATV